MVSEDLYYFHYLEYYLEFFPHVLKFLQLKRYMNVSHICSINICTTWFFLLWYCGIQAHSGSIRRLDFGKLRPKNPASSWCWSKALRVKSKTSPGFGMSRLSLIKSGFVEYSLSMLLFWVCFIIVSLIDFHSCWWPDLRNWMKATAPATPPTPKVSDPVSFE